MNPLPLSFAARSRSNSFKRVADRDMILHLAGDLRLLAPLRTTGLSLASLPIGAFACGKFGMLQQQIALLLFRGRRRVVQLRDLLARSRAPAPPALPTLRRGCASRRSPCSAACGRPSAAAAPSPLCAARHPTRSTSSIFAASSPPRVASRSFTKSGCSRMRRMSSMRTTYQHPPKSAKPRRRGLTVAERRAVGSLQACVQMLVLRWPLFPINQDNYLARRTGASAAPSSAACRAIPRLRSPVGTRRSPTGSSLHP